MDVTLVLDFKRSLLVGFMMLNKRTPIKQPKIQIHNHKSNVTKQYQVNSTKSHNFNHNPQLSQESPLDVIMQTTKSIFTTSIIINHHQINSTVIPPPDQSQNQSLSKINEKLDDDGTNVPYKYWE